MTGYDPRGELEGSRLRLLPPTTYYSDALDQNGWPNPRLLALGMVGAVFFPALSIAFLTPPTRWAIGLGWGALGLFCDAFVVVSMWRIWKSHRRALRAVDEGMAELARLREGSTREEGGLT